MDAISAWLDGTGTIACADAPPANAPGEPTPRAGSALIFVSGGKVRTMLQLPDGVRGCLFDLDGVLTQTAKIHAQAWKEMFDGFLRDWAERTAEPFREFDRPTDYDEYVDGPVAAGRRALFP
jgi:hypothetical protein